MENFYYDFTPGDLEAALNAKRDLVQKLKDSLSEAQIRRIKRDYHSQKIPFPACGMTVHPAISCSAGCLYCYVPRRKAKITSLSGKEMAFSLLRSPFFFPGRHGTFLALGSLTDPFLPQVRKAAFEIIQACQAYLGNPLQIATKQVLPSGTIRDIKLSHVCLLVSLSSLKLAERLEPRVPSPQDRLDFLKAIREKGGNPFVFLRPIIPGITNEESHELITTFKDSSVKGVVLGSLRLNLATLRRLEEKIDATEIKKRLPASPMAKGFQYIYTQDLKQELSSQIRTIGVQPFHSACCANAASHDLPCVNACWKNPQFCTDCWNQCAKRQLPELPDADNIEEFISQWLNKQASAIVDNENRRVHLKIAGSPAFRIGVKRVLETLLRAQTAISRERQRKHLTKGSSIAP
ncbi:MAG: hypothetical protein ACXAEI_16140 [Candidatus Hodarchaeales archaeon]|jgi:DNA repair photolyase